MRQASSLKIFLLLVSMKWWRFFQLITIGKRSISKIIRTELLFVLIIDVTLVGWKSCRREIGINVDYWHLAIMFLILHLNNCTKWKGVWVSSHGSQQGFFTHQVFDAYATSCKEIQRNLWKPDCWLLAVSEMERTAILPWEQSWALTTQRRNHLAMDMHILLVQICTQLKKILFNFS